jgi:phosphopantetheinyl transferase
MSLQTATPARAAHAPPPARAPAGWPQGPSHARLRTGVVDVWRAQLSCVSDEVLLSLSAEERARAAGYARPPAGQSWASARGVLRDLLARYLDAEPATIAFRVDRHGKPAVAVPARTTALSFSVSHSSALALYAFSRQAAVGVDVQVARSRRADVTAIARRAFGAPEARRLARLDPAAREREFLRAWTRYEATLKCRVAGADGGRQRRPWIAQLDVGRGAAAAVALGSAPVEVRCWSWSGVSAD